MDMCIPDTRQQAALPTKHCRMDWSLAVSILLEASIMDKRATWGLLGEGGWNVHRDLEDTQMKTLQRQEENCSQDCG